MQNSKPDLNELFKRYINGEATRQEQIQLERWLFTLDVHRQEIFADAREEAAVRSKIHAGILANITAKTYRMPTAWLRVAATVILLIGASTVLYLWQKARPQHIVIHAQATPLTNINLPDGSVVSLNSFSTLDYINTEFNDTQRKVTLTGEGYFEVASNAQKPFIVTTDALETVVHGTAFNIESYQEEQHIRISLIHGKVSVNKTSGDRLSMLTPGNMLEFSRADSVHHLVAIAIDNPQAWMTGELTFNNVPLADAFKKLERHYNIQINAPADLVNNQSVTARFANTSWQNVLHNILYVYDLSYTETGNIVTIRKINQ